MYHFYCLETCVDVENGGEQKWNRFYLHHGAAIFLFVCYRTGFVAEVNYWRTLNGSMQIHTCECGGSGGV